MAQRFKTVFEIDGDSSGAVAAQRAARQETEQLTREMTEARVRGEEMSESFDLVQQRAATMATVVGAGVAALGGIATRQITAAKNASVMADALAMTTTRMQELQYAADRQGLEDIGDILKDVADKIGDAYRNGGGEAMDAIDNLGLSVERLIAMKPDEQLIAIAQGLDSLPTGEQVNVMESLGNDATRLLPLLEDNAAALETFAGRARDINVALSAEDNQLLRDAGSSLDELTGYAEGLANTLTLRLAPGIIDTVDGIGALIDDMGGMEGVVDGLATATTGLAVIVGTRLATSLGAATTAMARKLVADQQALTAAAASARAEELAAEGAQRRAAAEQYAAKRMLGRAQAEVRATRGTDAHTAALGRLSIARERSVAAGAAATSATNAHTAALGRAAAASRAANVALRASSGALALLGGPAGAFLLAAGAAYTFREELGLVDQDAVDAANSIKQLQAATNDYRNELRGLTAEQLNARRVEAVQRLNEETEALGQAAAAAETARQKAAQLREQNEQAGAFGMFDIEGGDAGAILDSVDETNAAFNAQRQTVSELGAQIAQIDEQFGMLNDTQIETVELASSTATAVADTTSELDRQAESARGLIDELYPLQASQREYAEKKAQIVQIALQENKSNEWLEETLRRLQNQYRNAGSAAETYGLEASNAAEGAETAFDATMTAMERGVERMDDAFVDSWRSMLDGSESAFDSLKDIALDALAEIIHAYTTRQITANISAMFDGGGQGGQQGVGMLGGGQGGGFDINPNTLVSAGKNVYGWVTGSGASAGGGWASQVATSGYSGWAGSATGTGYGAAGGAGGGWMSGAGASLANAGALAAAYYAGGYVGSEIGGMVSDKQANSNYGQMAGTAIGSIWGPVGAGVGSALGSVVDTLFGSGGSDLDIAMMRRDSKSGHSWDHGIVAEGGLGAVGFHDGGSHEVADLWDIDEAKELVEGIAQLDSMLASLATSEAELADMRRVAQGHYGETSHPDQVADRLTSRYGRVLDQLGGDFGRFVRGLGGTIDEMVPQALAARQAFTFVSDSAETLNLRFRTTGASAYEAAASLAEMAGGMEGLQSLQANYTNAMYSDQERMVRLEAELRTEFRALGMTLPETREGFRDLVEAQNLNTRAGRENYTQLLRMVDGFNQLQQTMGDTEDGVDSLEDSLATAQGNAADAEQAVRRAWEAFDNQSSAQRIDLLELMGDQERILALQREDELAAMDEALRPIQERIWALQDEAQAQAAAAEAGQQYASALADAGEWLGGVLGNISEWGDQQQATGQSPGVNLDNAQQQFARQLAMAEAGDREALQSITQYADSYLAAGEAYYASGTGAQRIEGEILDALAALPEATSAEQFIVDGVRDALESSLADLPGGIAGAVSPLFDTIDLNADELIDYGEFERLFGGLASDERLAQIFEQLDANGDGTITALEAVERTTGDVEGNTKSLEERAADQIERLNRLVGEMTSTTDQFVTLNSTMSSLRESINALGVAQEEAARIERESKASELRTQADVEKDRLRAVREESLDRRDNLQSRVDSLAATQKSASSYDRHVEQAMFDTAVNNPSWERRMWDSDYDYYYQVVNGREQKIWRDDWDEIFNAASDYRDRREELSELRRQLSNLEGNIPGIESDRLDALRADYESLMGEPAPFAKGGAFTNSIVNQPTLFDMGLMGEAGPEAIMPLHRSPGGSLGIRAELPTPPVPSLPLLGQGDVVEAVNDLRREVAALREENARLLREGNQHAAAGVRVSQAGHQRSITQLERLADSNERINDRQRLETAR